MVPHGIRLAAIYKAYGNACAKLPGYKIPFSLGVIIGLGCLCIVMQKESAFAGQHFAQ